MNSFTIAGETRGRPSGRVPPRNRNWAKRARSSPVENKPAFPDTPPALAAVGSFTTPATAWPCQSPVGAVRRREAGGRPVAGFREAQGVQHLGGDERIQRLPGHAADDLPDQDEVQVAVDDARAGLGARRLRQHGPEQGDAVRKCAQLRHRQVSAKPRGVREEHADGDGAGARAVELRHIRGDRHIELQLAAVHQNHGRRGGRHRLGQ